MSIKPWEGDGGEEGYPDTDYVGQVEVGVVIVGLCEGVRHHSGITVLCSSVHHVLSISMM